MDRAQLIEQAKKEYGLLDDYALPENPPEEEEDYFDSPLCEACHDSIFNGDD